MCMHKDMNINLYAYASKYVNKYLCISLRTQLLVNSGGLWQMTKFIDL